MADSFFGFDASIPVDDYGGGGGLEEKEEDYDALNSETFGSAINGDWEDIHENLVRLDRSDVKDDNGESDLEINLSRVGMDDFDVAKEDNEGRILLDPSVWANPFKPPPTTLPSANDSYGLYRNPDAFLRQHFPNPFSAPVLTSQTNFQSQLLNQHQLLHHQQAQQQQQPILQSHHQQQQFQLLENINKSPMVPTIPPLKIMSLEDIERNIRNQQTQQNHASPKTNESATPTVRPQTPQHHRSASNQLMQQFQRTAAAPPPGLPPNNNKGPQFPPHIQMPPNGPPKPPVRLPPGFPPMQLMGHHQMPGNNPMPLPNNIPRPMNHNLPVALNNFAMHPNFNAMRPNVQPHRMHMMPPHFPPNMQNMQNTNQFNQRLVQEIQQNHPMLPFNRMGMNNNNFGNNNMANMHQQMNANVPKQQMNGKLMNNNMSSQQNFRSNGNLNDDYDDYANLMSNRDKQWLITIQLSQLNTGTPYIDDYYYTVYKERRSQAKGERENKAHKDNQMNHPFSQPKGHAHLVLISMGNKNGPNHQRNGQNTRERKNSESNKDKEQTPRTYTPLQFENSLGKLQCGSVTAPRKIIDMDVVGAESAGPFSSTIEISAQRKSRQLLIHIETLYRIVLKLEDLENPTAIATSLIVKERKERERMTVMDQQMNDNISLKDILKNVELDSTGNSLRSSMSLSDKDEESRDELLPKLLNGLTVEKVAQMMTVRKGKTLLRRSLALIKDWRCRWDIWHGVFSTLPLLVKKDKDDVDGLLFSFFAEFKNQIECSDMPDILKIGNIMTASDRKLSFIFINKFCISCIIVLILRSEKIYSLVEEEISAKLTEEWCSFLTLLANSANTNAQTQQLGATIQSDVIKPLVSHFSRFRELKSQQLLAVLTQETF